MGEISTKDLSFLPQVSDLRRVLQSLAMLDAILSPEWEYRYYSFNSDWGPGEQMGSMRNGSGDEFFALFNRYGCFLKGYDHEASINQLNLDSKLFYAAVPVGFQQAIVEPAFSTEHVTFCFWRRNDDDRWSSADVDLADVKCEDDPDGSNWMLSLLDSAPESYCAFAESYFEKSIGADAVAAIFRHQKLTDDLVSQLNGELSVKHVEQDAAEIGYPAHDVIA